ncbi:MAG: dephospho-CoA kinase [Candidatus Gracilibacteria bacterium]|nr:dephospho-CoA kinase [Candidatus Gracilibacteria bacterium]
MILGITGSIASGKSTALDFFCRNGFVVLDADKIVHNLYKKGGQGSVLIKKHFGDEYILGNGDVDRKSLRNLVFSDIDKLIFLNKLIHPYVYDEIKEFLKKNYVENKNVAIEAAYFDEDFLGKLVDKILLIKRSLKEVISVLTKERGFNEEIVLNVYSLFKNPKKIDFVVGNDGSLECFEKELLKIKEVCIIS